MRAYAMYHWGGIYMDTDVEVVRDSDVWRSEAVNLAMESSHWLNSHVMISHEPGNIIFKHMLDCMDYFSFPGEVPLELESGPRLITRVMQDIGYELDKSGTAHTFQKIVIHPPTTFSPHAWNEKYDPKEVKNDTLAIHHFTKLW
jgi:mannosyltransferase OCH1-like enzyme